MIDPRIKLYRDAALAMADGEFRLEIPLGPADELSQLGAALAGLGSTLQQRNMELLTLARVTERINDGLLLDEVMDKVYRSFRIMLPFDRMSLALLGSGGKVLTTRWTRTEARRVLLDIGYWGLVQGSSLKAVLESRQPRILNDLSAHLAAHPDSESTRLMVGEGMQSSLTCPLVARGRSVGVLFFSSLARDAYREAHQGIFLQIAGQLSLIVEKSNLYQELRESSEIRARFLGAAVQDLLPRANAVLGALEQMRGEAASVLDRGQQELLGQALVTQGELRDRIRAFLDINLVDSGELQLQLQDTDLHRVVDNVLRAHLAAAAARSIHLVADHGHGGLPVRIDLGRILQVLDTLVGNAIRASASTTTIILACKEADGMARIQVIDQGLGIAKDQLPGLFTLTRGDGEAGAGDAVSSGMGLAIARRIVEAHGGLLQVESTLGAGSTFTLCLRGGDPRQ
jgi:signal transduction histidine kinase